MFRAIIIDDETAGINTLKLMLDEHTSGIKVVATSTDPEKGITLIEDYKPEIVFLDINMPGMTGFELLQQLQYKDFKLVFTTAHNGHALQAIKNKAVDYLLKPIDIAELKACVADLVGPEKEKGAPLQPAFLAPVEIAVKGGIFFIRQPDIIRLEASGSYTTFYLKDNVRHLASKSIKEFEMVLDPSLFYRCHNSHIINLSRIVKFITVDGNFVQMDDGSLAEVARRNVKMLLQRLKQVSA